MNTFKLIFGTVLIIGFNAIDCKAEEEPLQPDTIQQETPKDFTQEDIDKLKQNVKDNLAIIASQGDVQDRRRLMKAVETIRKRQTQRANLKLPPEQQKTYQKRSSEYQDVDDFEDYLNDAFMQDLNKIKAPIRVATPTRTAPQTSNEVEVPSATQKKAPEPKPEIIPDTSGQDNTYPQKTSGRRRFSAPQ